MQLSADASGIVAGSDNGNVYYQYFGQFLAEKAQQINGFSSGL